MLASKLGDSIVVLSVRETRMIVERILLTTGLPAGVISAVGNAVLYSQAMGLGGLAAFESAIDMISRHQTPFARLVENSAAPCRLDACGNHAWLVANDVIDLAVADYRLGGAATVILKNAVALDELRVVEGLAMRQRARAEIVVASDDAEIRIIADCVTGPDPLLMSAFRLGFPVAHGLWRRLYDRSQLALTPDSIESRRHAGPVMIDKEGRVHGRDDDDTDFELLFGRKPLEPTTTERS